ncbi:MAG: ABC transporter ATP-binding protein [Polyangiales bacterium]
MARITLSGIAHRYAGASEYALKPLALTWRDGGAYALLGPSGCGKTTLLNIISGLLRPSEGRILIDDRDVTAALPQQRNIAQVFQFPVLYDTMTVFDNLAFPLRNRGIDAAATRTRVQEIAALLELTPDLSRRASGLSAELKQRISLGRGLVRRDVAAILLDEPLTVIDPHVKYLLRQKLAQIHAELKVTLIYVTHDQTEALTLADEVVVMSAGSVLQQGTPEQLFARPAHTFVGYFIGSPGMNVLPCTRDGDALVIEGQRLSLPLPKTAAGASLALGVRPEHARIHSSAPEEPHLAVTIEEVEQLGASRTVFARLGARRIASKVFDHALALAPGDACFVALPPAHTILYADDRAV